MSSRSTLALLVICSLSSFATSARIKQRLSFEGPKDANRRAADCGNDIATRTMELMDRIAAYFGNCRLEEEHATFNGDGTAVTITEEGLGLLCQARCKSDSDLSAEAPDSSDLIADCTDEASQEALKMVVLHDAFDEARKACSDGNVQEDIHTTPSQTNDEIIDSGDVVEVSEEVEVASPVGEFKGNMIKQLHFQMELKDALKNTSKPSCDKLKAAFKKCDFRRNGKVYIKKVSDSLDKLRDGQKLEMMDALREVSKKVNKDPDVDPQTFKDWVLFKLPLNLAVDCALTYAMGH